MEFYNKKRGLSLVALRKIRNKMAQNRLKHKKLGNVERYEYYNRLFEKYKESIKNFKK